MTPTSAQTARTETLELNVPTSSSLRRRLVATICSTLLLGVVGCARSPLEPTMEETLEIGAELQPAYNLLTSSSAPADWAGQSVGVWAARPRTSVRRIVIGDLPSGTQAQFNGVGAIIVSRSLLDQPSEVVAAFIAHELRHSDGLVHECADRQRDRSGDAGAWYVHISVLRSYGLDQAADIIRAHKFCEPK